MAGTLVFTSEAATESHPDRLCDRVSDAVVDACLGQDPEARVVCEACTKAGMVMILGEVVTKASVNYEQVVREAVKSAGYDSDDKGLDWRTMNVIVAIEEQSPDLAQAIQAGKALEDAGEQGVTCGYATDESPERMPLSHALAAGLCAQLDRARKEGLVRGLRPSGRAQVTLEYRREPDGALVPVRVREVALSAAHAEQKPEELERELLEHVVKPALPPELLDAETAFQLAGRGPGDAGASGRRLCELYGGWAAPQELLSGRDGSRPGRCGAYAARWAARSLVEAGLCRRCLVQLCYQPGLARPSVHVDALGTGRRPEPELVQLLQRNFDFRPSCLQRDLGLRTPQFQRLACHGHVGRSDLELAWERPKELQ